MVRYSISQVAKLAGVSSRTLRHYHAIGLLSPTDVGANGYRWYGRAELLRLQRILLLRQMGVGLTEIGQVLAGQVNEVAALRLQHRQMASERDRLSTVIDTIERTITDLTGDHAMDPKSFFRGLHQERSHLRNRLAATHGPVVEQAFTATESATAGWDMTDYEQAAAKNRDLLNRMATLMHHGVAPDDQHAQELIAEHHDSIAQFWEPDAAAYTALADLYLSDDRQRAWIADTDPVLPDWLAAAMRCYAAHRLRIARES